MAEPFSTLSWSQKQHGFEHTDIQEGKLDVQMYEWARQVADAEVQNRTGEVHFTLSKGTLIKHYLSSTTSCYPRIGKMVDQLGLRGVETVNLSPQFLLKCVADIHERLRTFSIEISPDCWDLLALAEIGCSEAETRAVIDVVCFCSYLNVFARSCVYLLACGRICAYLCICA